MEILKHFSVIILLVGFAYGQTDITPTPSDDFECPNNDDAMFPHPTDCTKYYVCTNGLAWEEQCPDGLFFDPINFLCTWPDLVNCNGVTSPPATTTTTRAPTSTNSPTDGPTSTNGPTEEPTEGPTSTNGPTGGPTDGPTSTNGPTEEPTEGPTSTNGPTEGPTSTDTPTSPSGDFQCPSPDGSFPNPEDCSLFYVCIAGTPTAEACPPGLWFDPALLLCNYPEMVDCEAAP